MCHIVAGGGLLEVCHDGGETDMLVAKDITTTPYSVVKIADGGIVFPDIQFMKIMLLNSDHQHGRLSARDLCTRLLHSTSLSARVVLLMHGS